MFPHSGVVLALIWSAQLGNHPVNCVIHRATFSLHRRFQPRFGNCIAKLYSRS